MRRAGCVLEPVREPGLLRSTHRDRAKYKATLQNIAAGSRSFAISRKQEQQPQAGPGDQPQTDLGTSSRLGIDQAFHALPSVLRRTLSDGGTGDDGGMVGDTSFAALLRTARHDAGLT